MKPFDLEEYNRLVAEGKTPKLVTRDGRSARIICTDKDGDFPLVALIKSEDKELIETYTSKGNYRVGADKNPELASDHDLLFADPEPTYLPFKDAKEVMDAVREHGPWIITLRGAYLQILSISQEVKSIELYECENVGFDELLEYKWADDGSVCGIKED